ncbi:reverse transcriptase N-terminal domain-containing protein [Nocardia sp. NPDC059154]|uniref:reverse transcriptase N-terminal domain-containing protein n=1 Tax=Nocardia sp. NPDC059154 TaxID=3346744 RepID=UPI003697A598
MIGPPSTGGLREENVRRLRQRIFKAEREGSLATVRNLQKLKLRSWSNMLVSVRQAAQLNVGRKTAGVDVEVALTSRARMELAVRVHREACVAIWVRDTNNRNATGIAPASTNPIRVPKRWTINPSIGPPSAPLPIIDMR